MLVQHDVKSEDSGRSRVEGPDTAYRFLMCRPQYFDVGYVINPWMAENVHQVDFTKAAEQWDGLRRMVETRARVQLIEPEPGLPDMVFTANAGLVVGDRAVLSNFRYQERKPEEPHFERWFEDQGLHVHTLPRAITFEGAGDALLDRERGCVWMGYGHRSGREAGPLVERILGLEVIPLELTDPRFYHLDTCFCPLPRGHALYYPQAFSKSSLELLEARFPEGQAILAGEEDAVRFACNAVNIGDTVILNDASEPLTGALRAAGFQVRRSPLTEFLRAGGAAKCLTLRMEPIVS